MRQVYVATITMGEYSDTGHAVVAVTESLHTAQSACELFEAWCYDPTEYQLPYVWTKWETLNDRTWICTPKPLHTAQCPERVQFTIERRILGV